MSIENTFLRIKNKNNKEARIIIIKKIFFAHEKHELC